MKYYLLLIGIFIGIQFIICMEDGGSDPNRRANKPIWNETYADALKRDLLMSYDKFARPTQHYNTTKVTLDMKIKHVDFDEKTSIFTVYSWFFMDWNDEKLKWNKTQYGNLSKLALAQHEVWQPDITLYNSVSPQNDFFGQANFVVESNGKVVWIPPATFKVLCDSNLRDWPFDTHQCTLAFGSWMYDGHEIDIVQKETNDSHLELYVENTEWEITNVQLVRSETVYSVSESHVDMDVPSVDIPYVEIRYYIAISRRSSIYHSVIIAPAFIVILLTLLTFWLPAQYGEKILLNGITALIIVLFLLYFSQKLNVMASHTPLIVLFYSHALYMVCFSMLISVIVINLTRLKHQKVLPWIIKKQLDGKLGDFLLLDHVNDTENDQQSRSSELREHPFEEATNDEQQIIQQCRRGKNSLKNDYVKLATAIDRIAFILYLFLFIIFGIAYSI
ncbi:acetylcholine receptor subunit alpha-type acr-16-like [Contarinia nasturtii]|uniref:acetylcholine receptor subunit alpha-type acr-16-like n=1 Tax=Contarinia nasturtii TaxID=265458 RepID=UPI0012D3A662|nr:acetylcholine receptor subunit alpha-type acr-16-like [Contarinia nasturtii]